MNIRDSCEKPTYAHNVDLIVRILSINLSSQKTLLSVVYTQFCTGKQLYDSRQIFTSLLSPTLAQLTGKRINILWKIQILNNKHHIPCYRFSWAIFSFNPSPFFQTVSWWSRLRPRFSMTSSWTRHLLKQQEKEEEKTNT